MSFIINVFKVIILLVVSYLLGSINSGVLLSRFFKHEDVRKRGSGNAGATNVARVYGIQFGLITLAGDVIKTLIAALIGHWFFRSPGVAMACAACIIGHCWPVFFDFKGGKGVAVGAAIVGILDWRLLIIVLSVFFIVVLLTKYVSLGSMLAASAFPILLPVINNPTWYQELLAIGVAVIIVMLHKDNIKRLVKGEESKFKIRK